MSDRYHKTFNAQGAIGHRRLVKATALDGVVAQASAPTDKIIGVADFPGGAADGKRVDVALFGPMEVELGGSVTPFDRITSDAQGRAVAAAPGVGVNHQTAGRVDVNGVAGDFAFAFINPGVVQG